MRISVRTPTRLPTTDTNSCIITQQPMAMAYVENEPSMSPVAMSTSRLHIHMNDSDSAT